MGRIPLLPPFVTQGPGEIQLSVRKLGAKLAMDSPFSACRSSGSVSHISWCTLPKCPPLDMVSRGGLEGTAGSC